MVSRLLGKRDEALQHFQNAAAVWPSHPWPPLEIGVEHQAAGRLDEAELVLRRPQQLSPRHYHVLMGLGRLLRKRGRLEEVAEMFHGAGSAEPAQAHIELAQILAGLGRLDEALAALDLRAETSAAKVLVLPAKARLLGTTARHEAALECWREALAGTRGTPH